jgi:hypothetical protein
MGSEMLRCAQHDMAGTHTDAWINVFLSMIGPHGWPDYFVKVDYRYVISQSPLLARGIPRLPPAPVSRSRTPGLDSGRR